MAFYSFIRPVDVPCPMSCGVFLKNVLALPLSIGTCSGLGMLGIDCMKHKISLVGFYCCCCCFFYLCSTCIVGFGYVVGRGGEECIRGIKI